VKALVSRGKWDSGSNQSMYLHAALCIHMYTIEIRYGT
jgi:hypothetical protein